MIQPDRPLENEYPDLCRPGSIQPHGILLAIAEPDYIIQYISSNTRDLLGIDPNDLLGRSIATLFDNSQQIFLQQTANKPLGVSSAFSLSLQTASGKREFDAFAHRTSEAIVVELEVKKTEIEENLPNFSAWVRETLANLQLSSTLRDFFEVVAQEVRNITQFDRVMVYQFDRQGGGEVVAEAKTETLSASYLGLCYPATDIPEAAREMYLQCRLRWIPDLAAHSVKLIAVETQENNTLDLSFSILRSVDSCCIEYHQNMGVQALLVIPLMNEGKLWGLIACHHQTAKYLPYSLRVVCELLGQFVSLELANQIKQEELDYKLELRSYHTQLLKAIAKQKNLKTALLHPDPRFLELVDATGMAIYLNNEIVLSGNTPNREQIYPLIEWLDARGNESLFQTDSLVRDYPPGEAIADTASGILLLRISQVRRYYLLWFRPEVIQTITWAGNPQESLQIDDNGRITLGPRSSFEQWQETMRFTAKPWLLSEIESAIEFRNALIGLVLDRAEELARLNQELERSNRELASFAFAASHDLKEPLRGIHNYSIFLLEDYANVLDEVGVERLETLVRLTQRMESLIDILLNYSRLGQTELNLEAIDLNVLVKQVIAVFRASNPNSPIEIRIPSPLPLTHCDPILINEVFGNLLTNAFKYNDKPDPWIEIGCMSPNRQGIHNPATIVLYVRDNGIGIRERHRETIFRLFKRLHAKNKYGGGIGAGLAIVKKIIERHGGQIWCESTYGEGSTFYFTLTRSQP
ncbi:MAG: GAF domain-containing protein [Cyanobacteria bacterium SBLK]|nr:GAF domain-containing protein [Cyanobacteria bacterium SBLK]